MDVVDVQDDDLRLCITSFPSLVCCRISSKGKKFYTQHDKIVQTITSIFSPLFWKIIKLDING